MINIESILARIAQRDYTVGVVGLGYVGLPLALVFAEKGFDALGFDIDEMKIEKLHSGKSYIKYISGERIKKAVYSGNFSATTDFSRIGETDAVIICVPTPLDKHWQPDLNYIIKTTESIAPYVRKNQLISLESTTYPGTTEEVMIPIIEKASGLTAGQDFMAAFSPEREDPNNPNFSTATIPKVVGGLDENSSRAACALYGEIIVRTVPVSSCRAAEATKLLENIFRSVNIALVNELKIIFTRMDIDIWEVIEAAKTKPFGYMPFYPGPGLGGHCIPIDPFYLTWKAKEFGQSTRFIELAGEINTFMPDYVMQQTIAALNDRGKALRGCRVLIVGLAYKSDIDDMRESPSLRLMELFKEKGASVDYYDPYIPVVPKIREYDEFIGKHSITLEQVSGYDVAVISTKHTEVDHTIFAKNCPLVIDTRNALGKGYENVLRA